MGYIVGAAAIVVMALFYADFRVKEDRIRRGEALDRGEGEDSEKESRVSRNRI